MLPLVKMTDEEREKAAFIAGAIDAPLPEGIAVIADANCYLRPFSGSEIIDFPIPENFSDSLKVCACGRAVLGLTKTKEEAETIILEWLQRDSGGWEAHASKYLGITEDVVIEIGEVFKNHTSYSEISKFLRDSPEMFFDI